MNKKVIFQSHTEKYSRRVLETFLPYFFSYSIFLFLPLFNIHGSKKVYCIWWTIILAIIIDMYFSSKKWNLNVISSITLVEDNFEIDVFEKDEKRTYIIHRDNISTSFKRKGGRLRILMLTIFDGSDKITDVCSVAYSMGAAKNVYQLEDIAFQIKTIA